MFVCDVSISDFSSFYNYVICVTVETVCVCVCVCVCVIADYNVRRPVGLSENKCTWRIFS